MPHDHLSQILHGRQLGILVKVGEASANIYLGRQDLHIPEVRFHRSAHSGIEGLNYGIGSSSQVSQRLEIINR